MKFFEFLKRALFSKFWVKAIALLLAFFVVFLLNLN